MQHAAGAAVGVELDREIADTQERRLVRTYLLDVEGSRRPSPRRLKPSAEWQARYSPPPAEEQAAIVPGRRSRPL